MIKLAGPYFMQELSTLNCLFDLVAQSGDGLTAHFSFWKLALRADLDSNDVAATLVFVGSSDYLSC
jgi:hypothetical protein